MTLALNHVGIPVFSTVCHKVSFGRFKAEKIARELALKDNCKMFAYLCPQHKRWHVGHRRLTEAEL